MKTKILILILMLCIICLGILSLLNYNRGYNAATQDKQNPYNCYDWKGFICVDSSSEFECCDTIKNYCDKKLCEVKND